MATKISFEQLGNEPDTSYERFVIYRDQGRHRNMRWAYQRYLDQKAAAGSKIRKTSSPSGPKNVTGSWVLEGKLYHWRLRCGAYELDRVLKEMKKRKRLQMQHNSTPKKRVV